LLLQVNQTISLKSGVQAFTCPEGFASPLAPVVQKDLKATPCIVTHISKYFPGISVVKVVTPSTKDAVSFGNRFVERHVVSASSLLPDFTLEYSYGLFAWHDVEIIPIPTSQVSVIPESESQKIKALFLRHSDNGSFVSIYAESKVFFKFLFQPSSYTVPHKSSHYHEVVGKPHHSRVGESVGASFFFMECSVETVKVDVGKQGRDDAPLRSPLFGTMDAAVLFHDRTLKPLPDQFQDTPVGYAPLELYHQLLMGNAVKVARKIRIIHLLPTEFEITADLVEGSVSAPLGAKTVGTIEKIGLKDRLKYKKYGGLSDPVPHARYAERAKVAVRLGDVGATHRGRFVAFGYQALLNFIQIAGYAICSRLNVLNTDAIDPRRSLVRPYSAPRRFQYISAMNAIVKGIEPKQRFSFSLAAQFPAQKRDFSRHPRFGYEPFCHPFRYGAFVTQAGLFSFHENVTEVRPLGSTGITPLPRYYGPLRIPTVNARRVMDSPLALFLERNPFASEFTSGLPGSSADLSTRALPNHPEQSHRFLRSFIPGGWQASPSLEGWPLSFERNEAESGSLALGSRLRRPGRNLPFVLPFLARTGLTPHVWLPSRDRPRLHVERAIHMSDSFQSDRSTRLGLAYQRRRGDLKLNPAP
jgi:hypothetical protein